MTHEQRRPIDDAGFYRSIIDAAPGSHYALLPPAARRELADAMVGKIGAATFARARHDYLAALRKHALSPDGVVDEDFLKVRQFTLEMMAELGAAIVPITRHIPDDLLCHCALDQIFPLESLPAQMLVGFELHSARWAELGRPVVHVSAKQAAALMLTDPSPEQAATIRPPWRAFVIELEDGALEAMVDGRPAMARRIVALRQFSPWSHQVEPQRGGFARHDRWVMRIDFDGRVLWEAQRTNADILSDDLTEDPEERTQHPAWEPTERLERRALRLACRLVLSLCLVISDPSRRVLVSRRHGKKHASRWTLKPHVQALNLDMPVKIDARRWVQDYAHGETATHRSIRWVVRGHFRNQAHGAGMKLHRLIWIFPFWKGPEHGVELARPRVIDDKLTGPGGDA